MNSVKCYPTRKLAVFVIMLLCSFLSVNQSMAQSRGAIKGMVVNQNDEAVAGVTIVATDSATNATFRAVSNSEGMFEIANLQNGNVYNFSFSSVGYESQNIRGIRVSALQDAMVVTLSPEVAELDEIVVIGYGTQRRNKTTGAITQVKGDDFRNMPIASVEQGLAAQMPGVQVMQNSGTPGGGISVRVRGLASISANNQPLYVIDGLPVNDSNTSMLNPNDIESVDVLKDAAAAAIYGSRGGNGVVLITTKKGAKSKPVISVDAFQGVQSVIKKIDMMDAYQYAELVKTSRNNTWLERNPNNKIDDPNSVRNVATRIPDFIQPYLNGEQGLTNTNWQDEIFRQAPMGSYSVSAAGGGENVKYFLSGNFFNQDGIIVNTNFKRYSLRANIDANLSSRIKLGVNLAPSFSTSKPVSEGQHGNDGIVTTALIAMPMFPVYNEDGSFALGNQAREAAKYSMAVVENPVAMAYLIDNKTNRTRLLGGTFIEAALTNDLKYKTYFGVDYSNYDALYYRPSVLGVYRVAPPSVATGRSQMGNTLNWITENTLTYNKRFNGHSFNVLAGYTTQKEKASANSITGTGFPNDQIHTISAATRLTGGTSTIDEWSLISYLGRVQYDYNSKYLLSASIRRDGSSRFGEKNRWGWFPSASLGWRISREDFFPVDSRISDLKLRASYGKTGNFNIPNYGSYALLSANNYVLNGTVVNGQAPDTPPNNELSWEKTGQINAGIDLGIFQDELYFTLDYYTSTTKDLLLDVPVPYASGYASMLRNVGEVKNNGFEFAVSSRQKFNELEWNASLNFSTNKNEVIALGPDQNEIISGRNITRIGEPIGAFFGYNVLGVFKDQAEIDAYPHLSTTKPGSYKYEDVNKDKQITAADRIIVGNPFPKWMAGFSNNFKYKNFDFSFLIQTVQGQSILNLLKTVYMINGEGWANASKDYYINRYISPAQPGNGYALNRVSPTDNNHQSSSLMVEDASFVRVRNIVFGYTLPNSLIKKLHLSTARFYISAQNPFTFTNYSGFNPEVSQNGSNALQPGIDYGAYPASKTFVFGLNVNF